MAKKRFQRRRVSRDRSDRHEQGFVGGRSQERGGRSGQDVARPAHRGSLEARHEGGRRQGRRLSRARPAVVQVRRLTERTADPPAAKAVAPREPAIGIGNGSVNAYSAEGDARALRRVAPMTLAILQPRPLLAEQADEDVLPLASRHRGSEQLPAIRCRGRLRFRRRQRDAATRAATCAGWDSAIDAARVECRRRRGCLGRARGVALRRPGGQSARDPRCRRLRSSPLDLRDHLVRRDLFVRRGR